MKKISVNLAGLKLKNPVFLASGIAGFGEEYFDLVDLNILGGFITKTITLLPKKGNPPPRIFETETGIVNSIGLENPGLKKFVKEKLIFIRKKFKIPVIVSVGGDNEYEYAEIVSKLNKEKGISGFELNLSCPNVGKKVLPAQDKKITYKIVSSVRKVTSKPVFAKLSPYVSDIVSIAQLCKKAGADAVSLINSFPSMIYPTGSKDRPFFGGLSGPCIKPIALRMVFEVSSIVKIPVIGCGGIYSAADAIEFLESGASAISVGSGFFRDPKLPEKIIMSLYGKFSTLKKEDRGGFYWKN